MIPADQMHRLINELEEMTQEGLVVLQSLPDALLFNSLLEGLRINRYNTRRSMTRNLSISTVRTLIQETILDKVYDEMMTKLQQ